MGVVFLAYDPDLRRDVAIKLIHPLGAGNEEIQRRFDGEAKASGPLRHPNIVSVYDRGEIDGYRFIVMEYVAGEPLSEVLSRGSLSHASLLHYLKQVASALDYAHERGVIHRDVKPGNIIIQGDGTAKILDFGIAKVITAGTGCTITGFQIGTPSYMAPEQVRAERVTGATDEWALAVVAYECLTRKKPFAATDDGLAYQICQGDLPEPHAVDPGLSHDLSPVFYRALAKSAEQRYSSCSEFVEGLTRALTVPSVERHSVKRIAGLVAGGIALGFGLLVSLYSATGQRWGAAGGSAARQYSNQAVAPPALAPSAGADERRGTAAQTTRDINELAAQGIEAVKRQDYRTALDAFLQVYRVDASFPNVASHVAGAYIRLNRLDEAEPFLHHALRQHPEDHIARYNYACFLTKRARFAEAVVELRRSLQSGMDLLPLMESDPDLRALRRVPQYEALIRSHRRKTQAGLR
jgi:cytochrome c-type biogenesis protein CcmH/NrfG